MKTLRRLVISPRPISDHLINTQDELLDLTYIPDQVVVQNEYRHMPGILSALELESDFDIAEKSLRDAVAEPGYVNIHLALTDSDWDKLGLRKTLYGQQRLVDKQIITYGRARKGRDRIAKKYQEVIECADGKMRKISEFSEEALNAWHELHHGLAELKVSDLQTHWVFYGYAEKYKSWTNKQLKEHKPRRWERKPKPRVAWEQIDFTRLDERAELQRLSLLRQVLIRIIELLTAQETPLVKPLKEWDTARVSQKYGNYNPSLYPTTKHHIGVDHAVPKGTRLYAPDDGEIVEAGHNKYLGNYYVYQYRPDRFLVNLHLAKKPEIKEYKAGEVLGEIGDSGFIIGIHSHTELFNVKPDRAQISAWLRENNHDWRNVTMDPMNEF